MDGLAQLADLARTISGSDGLQSAWSGTGPTFDGRKRCGLCDHDQPYTAPFLKHVCPSCAAIWLPGLCGQCGETSVTFTLDGQLSPYARCGCGGTLRQLASVPRPRTPVDPETAAAASVVSARRLELATVLWRIALGLLVVGAALGTWSLMTHHAAPAPTPTTRPAVVVAGLSDAAQQGKLAAARLDREGRAHDTVGCATLMPSGLPSGPKRDDFLGSCLAG